MEDYLIGKCYYMRREGIDTLLYVADPLDYGWNYVCKRLIKSTKGVGYISDTDVLYLNSNNLVEIDSIIWSKIHKILKMNFISCNAIIQNCKRYESPTRYCVCTYPLKVHYKLFEVLENSQILTRISNNRANILELETKEAVKFEKIFSNSNEWISPETYHKVKDNVTNTIEQIDDIWMTIL